MAYGKSRIDGALHVLQRRGRSKGLLGNSRPWLYVFIASFAIRKFRKAIGSEYDLMWRGEVRPGETIRIGHLAETYDGKSVRSRRRRIRRAAE